MNKNKNSRGMSDTNAGQEAGAAVLPEKSNKASAWATDYNFKGALVDADDLGGLTIPYWGTILVS